MWPTAENNLKRSRVKFCNLVAACRPAVLSPSSGGLVLERAGLGEATLLTQACTNERLGLVDEEDL